ncbi:MAG: hypothetical protein RR954_10260, partial [Christensenellaceae bacterium]
HRSIHNEAIAIQTDGGVYQADTSKVTRVQSTRFSLAACPHCFRLRLTQNTAIAHRLHLTRF